MNSPSPSLDSNFIESSLTAQEASERNRRSSSPIWNHDMTRCFDGQNEWVVEEPEDGRRPTRFLGYRPNARGNLILLRVNFADVQKRSVEALLP